MRLLSLDYDPVYGDATRATFAGDVSVFDYDIVIWDPAHSLIGYLHPSYQNHYKGLPSLAEHASVRIQADAARRRAEFVDFLKAGRVLAVIVRPPQQCYVDTGKRDYSGTGRSRVTTTLVAGFDLMSALPVSDCKFTRASGQRIVLDHDGPLIACLRKYQDRLRYDAVISNLPPGTVFARVAGTDRIVGFIHRNEVGGYLLLLPVIDLEDEDHEASNESKEDADEEDFEEEDDASDEEDVRWLDIAPEFQTDLLAAIEQLVGSNVLSRPVWAEAYATEEELRLRSEVVKQQQRIESARAKLARLKQKKEEIERKDQLFLGSGRALELEVRDVLQLLGGVITEPQPGRDDWRVSFPEGDAIIEVKGVTKSAAEKHAAQLEKWVAGTMEETGKPPKGILVVNTWRDRPLTQRTEEDFPHQMLPYSQSRGHCLMTGLQLFVIRAEVEKDAGRAESWRKRILETRGQITGCDDWKSIIQETKPEE